MTPIERGLRKRQQQAKKSVMAAKVKWGDLKALADEGQYHYNSYRRFLDAEQDFWSDGVYAEVMAYFEKKEKALAH